MNSRDLAALLSPLISELLLTLLLFPSPNPLSLTNSNSNGNLFPLIHHFLSISEIAASLSLLSRSRKRKRPADDENDQPSQLVRLVRLDSVIPRDPDSFKLCFRMSSSTFEWLAGLLEPLLECRDPVDSPLGLTAETRLGIGLFRLATGADFPEIARRFRVTDRVTEFCVKQLCRVLCTNFRFWVGFPTPTELDSLSSQFDSLSGLPNCCGVIACTRFEIAKTNSPHEQSIATQIVVDSSSRILSIIAGFSGENSDFRILKSSTLYKDIENGKLLDSDPTDINGVSIPQYLIGYGNYPLLPWLIVPFVGPETGEDEERFNSVHRSMRASVVRTIASLKNWGVLNKPIEAEFKTAVAYIGACSILHNVLLMREDHSALCDESVEDFGLDQSFMETSLEGDLNEKGLVIRRALTERAK
ncbi:Nuclease [Actinidia chinensis var. chinensis]|uniref:Nuclease n=1 Tax=Actinidia chinensis var. chinensis TaxID=1590841 RepID=A0A2R6RC09_ACTCC|nr:Nuclease [Actinidia chinensis var. chinensis]